MKTENQNSEANNEKPQVKSNKDQKRSEGREQGAPSYEPWAWVRIDEVDFWSVQRISIDGKPLEFALYKSNQGRLNIPTSLSWCNGSTVQECLSLIPVLEAGMNHGN